jgi:hypothetical protein
MSAHLHLIYREFRHRQLLGNLTGNVHRSRHALNADTIREMHLAFRRGGRPPRWWMGSSRSRSRTGADDGADQGSRLALLWQIFAADERDGIERSRWRGS